MSGIAKQLSKAAGRVGALSADEADAEEGGNEKGYPPEEKLQQRAVIGWTAPLDTVGIGVIAQAVNADVVPKPKLMDYRYWLKWRQTEGKRPLKKRDGKSTTKGEESYMWRYTMRSFYGEKWRDLLVNQASTNLAETTEGFLSPDGGKKDPDKAIDDMGPSAARSAEEERLAALARLTGQDEEAAALNMPVGEYALRLEALFARLADEGHHFSKKERAQVIYRFVYVKKLMSAPDPVTQVRYLKRELAKAWMEDEAEKDLEAVGEDEVSAGAHLVSYNLQEIHL